MPSTNETQKIHFYSANWSEELDETLIDVLKEQCCSDYGCVPLNNSKFLDMIVDNAADCVNYIHDTAYTNDQILERFENLAARHQCFRTILDHNDVTWDFPKNLVFATYVVWESFISDNSLALAYKENGEFAWCDLEKIFGIVIIRAKVYKPRPPRTSEEVIKAARRMKGVKCSPRNGNTEVSDRMSDTNGVKRVVDSSNSSDAKVVDYSGNNAAASSQASCLPKSWEF